MNLLKSEMKFDLILKTFFLHFIQRHLVNEIKVQSSVSQRVLPEQKMLPKLSSSAPKTFIKCSQKLSSSAPKTFIKCSQKLSSRAPKTFIKCSQNFHQGLPKLSSRAPKNIPVSRISFKLFPTISTHKNQYSPLNCSQEFF